MKYGYAHSTDDQTTALQLAALKKVGCTPEPRAATFRKLAEFLNRSTTPPRS